MKHWWTFSLVAAMGFLCVSCDLFPFKPLPTTAPADLHVDPLPVQQAQAYPETITKRFVSLADFEEVPSGAAVANPGHEQVKFFAIERARSLEAGQTADVSRGGLKFVTNITRTGAGALEVTLPQHCELVYKSPLVHDVAGYTLLSFAMYSPAIRDDLQVTLVSDAGSWTSPRTLVTPGWNTVLVDIQRLGNVEGFDIHSIRQLRLGLTQARADVSFNVDDIMLIDNRRAITPLPEGLSLEKSGLDYRLVLGGYTRPISIAQGADGLWRMGGAQTIVQVLDAREAGKRIDSNAIQDERIDLLGDWRIGQVKVLENNAVRLRIENAWYFPSRQGEWASLAVRQVKWLHTFYGDGRWVTHLEINNSGGEEASFVRLVPAFGAAWWGKGVFPAQESKDEGPVWRWDFLQTPEDHAHDALRQTYLKPAKLQPLIAGPAQYARGDADQDGYDESQGCCVLSSRSGQCRFIVQPGAGGLSNGVFRVMGPWGPAVSAQVEGRAVKHLAKLEDGSVIFLIEGLLDKPTTVEVSGPP